MQRPLLVGFSAGAAIAVLLAGSSARAQAQSVMSIQFIRPLGACCYDACWTCCACPWMGDPHCCSPIPGLDLAQYAGVPPYVAQNWNVVMGNGGVLSNVMDGDGNSTTASLLWEAPTFSDAYADELGFVDDANKQLMSGYLDQNTSTPSPTFIQITGIPDSLAAKYDVVIYTLTMVPNANGRYSVNTANGDEQLLYVVAGGNGASDYSMFNQATGNDSAYGPSDFGNYVVFPGLSGKTVTITATNETDGKAPVNGVQIATAQ